MKIHIVQQGDTLWKLAKKYDVDFEKLKAVNSHLSNPDVIMPGMKIKIPTGGVPVKKQIIKKEEPIQVKEMPKVKEAPKMEVKVPLPVIPEKVKVPAKPEPLVVQQPIEIQPIYQQPILTQQQYEQHLHNMNMNFNIYKPMPAPVAPPPKVPAPPKMPEMVKLPKMEMPLPKSIPVAPPPAPPKKEVPILAKVAEIPMVKQPLPTMPQMQQNCYPITGVIPGCSCNVPPVVQQYAQGFPQYPPMPPMGSYGFPQGPVAPPMVGYTPAPMGGYPGYAPQPLAGYPQPTMPSYPPVGYGMGQPPFPPNYGLEQQNDDEDFSAEMPPPTPFGNMQIPPNYWGQPNFYGDVTMQQQPIQPSQTQQWGYQQQPMYQHPPASPHPVLQRQAEEDTEN